MSELDEAMGHIDNAIDVIEKREKLEKLKKKG